MKISTPIRIRLPPPRMEALPARRVPNFRPRLTPAVKRKKVRAATPPGRGRVFPGVVPGFSRGFPEAFPKLPRGFSEVFPWTVPGSRAQLAPFLRPAGPTPNSGVSGRRFRTRQGCVRAYGGYNTV